MSGQKANLTEEKKKLSQNNHVYEEEDEKLDDYDNTLLAPRNNPDFQDKKIKWTREFL